MNQEKAVHALTEFVEHSTTLARKDELTKLVTWLEAHPDAHPAHIRNHVAKRIREMR